MGSMGRMGVRRIDGSRLMVDVWCMIHDSRFTNNDSWFKIND